MPTRPMLDDLELPLVQQLDATERQERAQHAIPALEGDFLQPLGRRATAFTLEGVIANVDGTVAEQLKKLREKFRAAAPVNFVADIATATRVDTVLIEEMSVRELAGKTQRFEYAFALREFIPAPAPEIEPPPPPPPPLETGLIVEVIVEGQPGFDFSKVTVTVTGNKEDRSPHNVTLTNRTNNLWTEDDFPPGNYTANAVVNDPPMSGSATANVLEGQKTKVTIVLRQGTTRAIAKAFVVHFRFDKAFIEPCMRKVLNAVAAHAAAHKDEKMVVVGHTDKSGSDAYNLSLGDRRARSVYAFLNLNNDRASSLAEWNELRRASTGTLPSLRDNWGTMQYQFMLEDLGFLPGNVDGVHGGQTDAAVQAFRASKGLPPGNAVDDAVWAALIEDYHTQEPQGVDPAQRLPNKDDAGCDSGALNWLSCGEQMPLPTTPSSSCAPETAWRPNRRAEILFVTESKLPCKVPQPVTFDKNPPPNGVGGTTWCLGPGNPDQRCCFLTRDPNVSDKWLIQPAEPGSLTVTGSIRHPDGTPFANTEYILIAPDGEFMDGERLCGDGRGTPTLGRTDANGQFNYAKRSPTPVGIYTLEVRFADNNPHVAHLASEPPSSGRGSVVCARLDPNNTVLDVIVFDGTPVPAVVTPSITLARNFVIVKKPHTNPARVEVTLRTDSTFSGTGTLTRSGNTAAVRLFTAAVGGTEITFNGTDNVFPGATLAAGVTLFAEAGPAPSAAADDYTLTLTLTPTGAGTTVGAPATATLTAVMFTLDIALSRPAPGANPPIMTEADKINVGRPVQFRDVTFTHERAMMIVRQPTPVIPVTLELLPQNARVQAFTQEIPAAGQAPLANNFTLAPGSVPATGSQFFVEGTGASVSTAVRDTGYLLRVQGIPAEVDKVVITTVQLEVIAQANNAATGLRFVRFGLWDQAYDANGEVKTGANEANHFIGQDARRFHLRVRDVSQTDHVDVDWTTLKADRVTGDDAPARPAQTPVITLVPNPAGSKVFISRALILVIDDENNGVNRTFPTESGLSAPLDTGPRQAGQSNHRTRRARIDGFMRVEYSPLAGVRLGVTLSVFDRAVPFNTTAAAAIAAGTQTVTPAAMSIRSNGVLCNIKAGSVLTVGTGATQETVTVTAVTPASFTATFANAHAAPVQIAGTADERKRIHARVIRYTGAAVPGWNQASNQYITDQFARANLHWNQIGVQIDADATQDRPIPANALFPPALPPPDPSIVANKYPFVPPLGNSTQQTAVLADLLATTPDNTLTVIFLDLTGPANAYAAIAQIVPDPVPITGQAPIAIGNRFFIFMHSGLNLTDETLAHELHHVIFNRFDLNPALLTTPDQAFYTLNTRSPAAWVALAAARVPPVIIALPDVRVYWRLQNRNAPDPNNDPNNNNIINWARRPRTARFPQPFNFSPADGTTGNNFSEDF